MAGMLLDSLLRRGRVLDYYRAQPTKLKHKPPASSHLPPAEEDFAVALGD